MTTPTNYHLTIINRFCNTITASVVYINPLGNSEVHVETNDPIEIGYDHQATYVTPGDEAKGRYKADDIAFTERETYIYKGTFTRDDA
jgi:hypothetical protein